MKKTSLVKRLAAAAVSAAVLLLVLAACGSSSADSSTPTDTPEPTAAAQGGNGSSQATPTEAPAPPASNFDTSKNIAIIAREDGSGTKSAFMEIIGHKGKADPATVIIQNGTAGILAEVKGNPAAIAYESLGYVTNEVRLLTVDGVEATVSNIQSGEYKLSRPLSVVYREETLDDPVCKAFLEFIQSADAQAIISAEPFISIYNKAPVYMIDAELSGTIDISGSTSLQPLMVLLAEAFENLQPNVTVSVSGGGSGTGYNNAQDGVSEFGMISEEFSQEKAAGCTYYIVAKDGIAVIVHTSNPLTDITMDQLNAIYDEESGSNPKWSDLIN